MYDLLTPGTRIFTLCDDVLREPFCCAKYLIQERVFNASLKCASDLEIKDLDSRFIVGPAVFKYVKKLPI